MGEDGGDGEASGALDVHEEGAGSGHKGLELVLAGLSSRAGVDEINGENLENPSVSTTSSIRIRYPLFCPSMVPWPIAMP